MSAKTGDEEFIEKLKILKKEAEDHRQIQKELRHNEEKYRSAFEQSGAPAMIIEDDMTISMANREFERLTGYTKDEIEGKMKWTVFVAEEDVEIIAMPLAGFIAPVSLTGTLIQHTAETISGIVIGVVTSMGF